MTIKPLSTSVTILLLLVAVAAFEGCASLGASKKESLLSAAGFGTRTPSTPKRQALYSQLAPYKLERRSRLILVLHNLRSERLLKLMRREPERGSVEQGRATDFYNGLGS